MKVKIEKSKAFGEAFAPPSKSFGHRALICASLSEKSTISKLSLNESKDISATAFCLKSLGAKVNFENGVINIGGLDFDKVSENTELFCDESGSTLRFLIPLCLLTGKKITLKGSERLFSRPLSVYENICKDQGIDFSLEDNSLTLCGRLKPGKYTVPGNISSQFISGLLFALPLLNGDSVIEVTDKFESESYVDITVKVLSDFGIRIVREDNRFIIKGNQKYKSTEYAVEGDYSNAAFLDVFNFLGGEVSVLGLNPDSLQGDKVYKEIFKGIDCGEKEFDLSDCPDLAPILFAFSSLKGGAKFKGTSRLKIKESDRAEAMADELKKFGIKCIINENSVEICEGKIFTPTEPLNSHNDHRIVMALSVLCTQTGGEIDGAEAINKSFPEFFNMLKRLKVGIKEI